MYCRKPNNPSDNLCYAIIAAGGTPCGDGKICLGGQCVSDARGKNIDESCPFGDVEGENSIDCATIVSGFLGNCYQTSTYERCCGTCNAAKKRTGCEYGDRFQAC